jgi:SAM-dependent methyltransferase
MTEQDAHLAALIELHRGLDRLGPGDEAFSRRILASLPALPDQPLIADLGCGAGASALLLAAWFEAPVRAVDLARAFLDRLEERAQAQGLSHLVTAIEADIGALDWPSGSIDLLWSEGAAYNLGFERALHTWGPLLAPGGIAVISELSWFTEDAPAAARAYWTQAYPEMGSEAGNMARAFRAGLEVLGVDRLPTEAWWANYYGPLQRRMATLGEHADQAMEETIAETELEMSMLRRYGDVYGYSFYILRASG